MQPDIDNLGFSAMSAGIITGTSRAPVHLTSCTATSLYVPIPTTVATGPSGTLQINNPTITWTHAPGADAPGGQDAYRVVVYTARTGAVAWDTLGVAGAAASQVVGAARAQRDVQRLRLDAPRQTTDGIQQWSAETRHRRRSRSTLTGPTVDVTAPVVGAVVGTTSPLISWTHTPGAGAQTGQTSYRVIVFDTSISTPWYDSGVVPGSASSARIGPLDPDASWIVWVSTAQTTYGALQWSPTDATSFTIDVVPALIASVVPTPSDVTGSISVLVTRNTSTPIWQTIDVEASYDAGVTWQPVRGATHLSANGNSVTVVDHEAPNDVAARYRARASRVVSGQTITEAMGHQHLGDVRRLGGNDVWLKDPAHPERNIKVCVSSLPEPLWDRVVGVFRPIGAHYPVVVSDVLQAFTAERRRDDVDGGRRRSVLRARQGIGRAGPVAGAAVGMG